jgi:hypothetical protein
MTPAASPPTPIQIHTPHGAGSPAIPSEPMWMCAHPVRTSPATVMVGTANRRQWKDRQPMAHNTIAAVNNCTDTGTHPCVSGNGEMKWRTSLNSRRCRCVRGGHHPLLQKLSVRTPVRGARLRVAFDQDAGHQTVDHPTGGQRLHAEQSGHDTP